MGTGSADGTKNSMDTVVGAVAVWTGNTCDSGSLSITQINGLVNAGHATEIGSVSFRIESNRSHHGLHHARSDSDVRPIFKMPIPSAFNSRIRASIEGLTARRPSFVSFALALASPAFTRSRIMPRSNSANTPSI